MDIGRWLADEAARSRAREGMSSLLFEYCVGADGVGTIVSCRRGS